MQKWAYGCLTVGRIMVEGERLANPDKPPLSGMPIGQPLSSPLYGVHTWIWQIEFDSPGIDSPKWEPGTNVLTVLNELGQQGWEVVSVEKDSRVEMEHAGNSSTEVERPVTTRFWLKRPA